MSLFDVSEDTLKEAIDELKAGKGASDESADRVLRARKIDATVKEFLVYVNAASDLLPDDEQKAVIRGALALDDDNKLETLSRRRTKVAYERGMDVRTVMRREEPAAKATAKIMLKLVEPDSPVELKVPVED